MISLAGGLAEELTGEARRFDHFDRVAIGRTLAAEFGCRTGSERGLAIVRALTAVCDRLVVDMHRAQIAALAQALMANGKIAQADIRRIVGRRIVSPREVISDVVDALERGPPGVIKRRDVPDDTTAHRTARFRPACFAV